MPSRRGWPTARLLTAHLSSVAFLASTGRRASLRRRGGGRGGCVRAAADAGRHARHLPQRRPGRRTQSWQPRRRRPGLNGRARSRAALGSPRVFTAALGAFTAAGEPPTPVDGATIGVGDRGGGGVQRVAQARRARSASAPFGARRRAPAAAHAAGDRPSCCPSCCPTCFLSFACFSTPLSPSLIPLIPH